MRPATLISLTSGPITPARHRGHCEPISASAGWRLGSVRTGIRERAGSLRDHRRLCARATDQRLSAKRRGGVPGLAQVESACASGGAARSVRQADRGAAMCVPWITIGEADPSVHYHHAIGPLHCQVGVSRRRMDKSANIRCWPYWQEAAGCVRLAIPYQLNESPSQ